MGRLRKKWKAVTRTAGYGLAVAARAALAALPAGARLRSGEVLGSLAWRLAWRERRRALAHLEQAFGPDRPAAELRRIGRECFRNLGRCVAEVCALRRARAEDVLEFFDEESAGAVARCAELAAAGPGVVAVTAHLDNWELSAAYASARGMPLSVVARHLYFEPYDRMVNEMRRRFGAEVIYQDESPRKMLRALRAGRVLALLADQDVSRLDGVFVPFFGRPAYTPTGPVALAVASGAPVVLMYGLRTGRDRHRLVLEGPLEFDRAEKHRAALEGTRLWSARLEAVIRERPEQWVWMHRRWRTRPEDRPEAARRSGCPVAADQAAAAGEPA